MPSTAQVFKQVKTLAPSFKSSYQWALRSYSKPDTTTNHELGSKCILQHRPAGSDNMTQETLRAESDASTYESKLDHSLEKSLACEDGGIRKTTDIEVMRKLGEC